MSLKDIFDAIFNGISAIWTADLTSVIGYFALIIAVILISLSIIISIIAFAAMKAGCNFYLKKISNFIHSKNYKNINVFFDFLIKPFFIVLPFLFALSLHFIVFPNFFWNSKFYKSIFIIYLICSSVIFLIMFLYDKFTRKQR
jgi:hypothetical protein